MAEKETNSTSSSTKKQIHGAGWLLNFASFIAVGLIGISLILSKVGFGSKVSGAFSSIASIISYCVLIAISFFYIIKRKKIWMWVLWAVSVVLIVISYIL